MPPRLVTDAQLLDRLTDVFRSAGFEGASLSALAMATGLQKSSLYHRFPDGKSQMAAEVAERLGRGDVEQALAPLFADGPIEARVRQVGRSLTAFYEGGAKSCLLDTMSIGAAGPDAQLGLAAAANRWIQGFAQVAAESGADRATAWIRAQDAIAAIEGALVLARVTKDTRPFARAIQQLPAVLLGIDRTGAGHTNKER